MEKKNAMNLASGVLVFFRAGRWDARANQDVKKLGKNIPKNIIYATKSIIDDRAELKRMGKLRRQVKNHIAWNSISTPMESINWVPKEIPRGEQKTRIKLLDEYLQEKEKEYHDLAEELIEKVDQYQKAFKKKYPKYYDPTKYPSVKKLRKKFYFTWRFFDIDVPDPKSGKLSPKMYEREMQKVGTMVKEMEEMTITLVGNKILNRLETLHTQCEEERANAGTINAINRLSKQWEDLWSGHVDHKKLRMVMNRVKKQMRKVDTERLRNNEDFRNAIGKETGKLIKRLQNIPNVQLKRRIDI